MSNETSFEHHFSKLESLSNALQANKVSIDELIPSMKEALKSIKVCKSVLKNTQSQLSDISAEFAELDTAADAEKS